jgi:uncharacterized protein (DUF488 family)
MTRRISKAPAVVWTVGHSTHSLGNFRQLLQSRGIEKVIDIRTIPRSRHNPQFNQETLPGDLTAFGIGYVHMPGLGGLRHSRKDSVNTGWRNSSFRGFADYMQTEDFEKNIEILLRQVKKERVVLMCAEALPWRCHRSLIADALVVRGISVEHIMSPTKIQPHELTLFALVQGTQLIYPATDS